MNKDYCDISILLDKSGSMQSVKKDTIGGINSFLLGQSELNGKCRISLYQFDNKFLTIYQDVDAKTAPKLSDKNYIPNGNTALLDGIGKIIELTGERISKLEEKDRPSKVIVVIQTDGEENASTDFTKKNINEIVKHQQDKYSWEFIFLGANMDAIAVAESYGFKGSNTLHYASNSIGTMNAFVSLSGATCSYRTSYNNGGFTFTDTDRKLQEQELNKQLV